MSLQQLKPPHISVRKPTEMTSKIPYYQRCGTLSFFGVSESSDPDMDRGRYQRDRSLRRYLPYFFPDSAKAKVFSNGIALYMQLLVVRK